MISLKALKPTSIIECRTIILAIQPIFHGIVMTVVIVVLIYFLILASTVCIITRATTWTIPITRTPHQIKIINSITFIFQSFNIISLNIDQLNSSKLGYTINCDTRINAFSYSSYNYTD